MPPGCLAGYVCKSVATLCLPRTCATSDFLVIFSKQVDEDVHMVQKDTLYLSARAREEGRGRGVSGVHPKIYTWRLS
jgi:hypothetical protein